MYKQFTKNIFSKFAVALLISTFLIVGPVSAESMATVDSQAGSYAASVPVLLYHGESSLSGQTSAETFAAHMQALHDNGWKTITLSQFRGFIKNGEPVPEKSFLLTFDDGRKNTFYSVDPILKKLDFTAVMFVITGFSLPETGKVSSFYLNEGELATMSTSTNWEIQSHGNLDHYWYGIATTTLAQATTTIDTTGEVTNTVPGHFLSNKFIILDSETGQNRFETDEEFTSRVTADLASSKRKLEMTFDKPVRAFAFPFNDYGQDTTNFSGAREILNKVVPTIYDLAFYQVDPSGGDVFNYPNKDQYLMKRIEPLPGWTSDYLLSVLNNGKMKQLSYYSDAFNTTEWLPVWGNGTSTPNGTLLVSATASTTGAEALLNGSRAWTDYKVTANATVRSGDITLIGRYKDSQNFLTCSFSGKWVGLGGTINGVHYDFDSTTVKEMTSYLPWVRNTSVSMSVRGNTVSCGALGDGAAVTYKLDDGALSSGGIGVETWNATPGIAKMELRSIKVEAI